MGLFKKDKDIDLNEIISVIIIEQTQNYKKSKAKAGLFFGNSILNPDVVFMDGDSEPDGCTYTFSVTYKNGKKELNRKRVFELIQSNTRNNTGGNIL